MPADASRKTVAGLNGARHFLPRGVLSVFSLLGDQKIKMSHFYFVFQKLGHKIRLHFLAKINSSRVKKEPLLVFGFLRCSSNELLHLTYIFPVIKVKNTVLEK